MVKRDNKGCGQSALRQSLFLSRAGTWAPHVVAQGRNRSAREGM